MNRFWPSIVVAGGQPYEEDTMEQFSINGINFYGVKLSAAVFLQPPTSKQVLQERSH